MSVETEDTAPAGLEALGALREAEDAVQAEPKLDAYGRAYATGKRKNAIARVWLKPGNGRISVNGKTIEVYFARPVLRMLIGQPLPRPTARTSSTWSARSPAAGCPARPARCATASPRR